MSPMQNVLQYEQELKENESNIREMVLESVKDIKAGKGRDYNEFFDELEKRYKNV